MDLVDISIKLVSLIFSSINVAINFGLLYLIFVAKKFKKSSGLTLFYVRFAIDGILGLQTIIITSIAVTEKFNLITISRGYQLFFFAIFWPTVNLASTRGILVLIITIDRTLAVFLPIFYHNNRTKVPNVFLIFVVLCYPALDNMMMWTVHIFVSLTFLAIATKLFIWNHYKNRSKSKGLERANHLALIDAATIFLFDVAPILILTASRKFEYVSTVIAFTKAAGYTLAGGLVYRTLKRRSKAETNAIVGNVVVAIKANSFY